MDLNTIITTFFTAEALMAYNWSSIYKWLKILFTTFNLYPKTMLNKWRQSWGDCLQHVAPPSMTTLMCLFDINQESLALINTMDFKSHNRIRCFTYLKRALCFCPPRQKA